MSRLGMTLTGGVFHIMREDSGLFSVCGVICPGSRQADTEPELCEIAAATQRVSRPFHGHICRSCKELSK